LCVSRVTGRHIRLLTCGDPAKVASCPHALGASNRTCLTFSRLKKLERIRFLEFHTKKDISCHEAENTFRFSLVTRVNETFNRFSKVTRIKCAVCYYPRDFFISRCNCARSSLGQCFIRNSPSNKRAAMIVMPLHLPCIRTLNVLHGRAFINQLSLRDIPHW